MKRKITTTPTRIYSYGCRPPVDGADVIEGELRRAHHYRNALVEIERRRRDRIAAVQRAHDGIGPLLQVIAHLESEIADLRADARRSRSGGGDRKALADAKERIAELRADLAVMRWLRGWAKARLRGDDDLKAAYEQVTEQARAEIKAVRNADDAPYWGTYLLLEKAAEPWPKLPDAPRFCRYDGSGRIGVQIQGGMTVAELEGGEDTRLRILPAIPFAATCPRSSICKRSDPRCSTG